MKSLVILFTANLLVFALGATTSGSTQTLPREADKTSTQTPTSTSSHVKSHVTETIEESLASKINFFLNMLHSAASDREEKSGSGLDRNLNDGSAEVLTNLTQQIEKEFPTLARAVRAELDRAEIKVRSLRERLKQKIQRMLHSISSGTSWVANEIQKTPGNIWRAIVESVKSLKSKAANGSKKIKEELKKLRNLVASISGFVQKNTNATEQVLNAILATTTTVDP